MHDLNNYPWPLDSDTFDRILCSHIVEHVADITRFMGEVHRLGKAGARVEMVTPHFSNRYSYTIPRTCIISACAPSTFSWYRFPGSRPC